MCKIGVIADIKRAFLQISICPRDRDLLRFLWYVEGKIRVFRHRRVVFGVSSSPFLLGATLELHLKRALDKKLENIYDYSVKNVKKFIKLFYVDNCVASVDSQMELVKFMQDATSVMAAGGFELRAWEHSFDGAGETAKVLGMLWQKDDDTLSVNLSFLNDNLPQQVTKRIILSTTHKVYDPIGLFCPVMLQPKLLLQKTWNSKIKWDDEIEGFMKEEFLLWLKDLHLLKNVKISRNLSETICADTSSIHAFCDASGDAYATVVFLRTETSQEVDVALLEAPLKEMAIPRLELLAATIAARLVRSLITALNWENENIPIFYWTDSTMVLCWIQRECQWNVFVWNRIQEIKRLSLSKDWRHIPGESNPADLPSRGCSTKQLITSKWWEGPAWLKLLQQEWPSVNYEADEEEVVREKRKTAVTSLLCNKSNSAEAPGEPW